MIADNEEFELRLEVEEIAPHETSSSQTLGAGGLLPPAAPISTGTGTRNSANRKKQCASDISNHCSGDHHVGSNNLAA